MIRLAYPYALLLLLVLPPLWYLWLRRERRPVIQFSSLAVLRAAGGAASARVRLILPILRTVALICLIVAVARPQKADESSGVFAEGIAIQMVVDTSSSMLDTDLSPPGQRKTRLEVVKKMFADFVRGDPAQNLSGRPNDLIGMVRFARYPDAVCPLTLDRNNLLEILESTQTVTPRSTEDRTAIGDGLALAVERLKDLKRATGVGEQLVIKSKIIILLTDGENNTINLASPEQAGELAATYGIKVYTILAGTGQDAGFTRMPVNDRDLKKIAEVTGGKFFHARDNRSLTRIYEEIDKLERVKVEERRFVRWGELSQLWLLAAFLCLGLQTFLDATRLRKIP